MGSAESISLRALSRTVGVTASAAYQHFRDREALLEAVALDGFLRLKSALHSAAAEGQGRAGGRLAGAYLDFAKRNPSLLALMFRLRPNGSGSRVVLDDALGECLAEFVAVVDQGRVGRSDHPADAIRRAVAAWASLHGFAMLSACQAFGALDDWMLPAAADLILPRARER